MLITSTGSTGRGGGSSTFRAPAADARSPRRDGAVGSWYTAWQTGQVMGVRFKS
jgi:hypothetical protein